MDFTGKTALITGAAGAIGKDIALELYKNGAKVLISDINQDAVDAAAKEIGEGCLALAADVTKADQVQKVVAAAADAFDGKIDILVNVAGIIGQGNVEDITEEDWDKMMAVNCKGTFLFTKYVVPMMKANNYGKIVNFSSKSGKTGSAIMSHYCAAKAAIIGFTQALAFELAPNINVNCVCPGITENTGVWQSASSGYIENLNMSIDEVVKKFTSKVPLGRLAKIEDVTAVTTFLCSKGADYMTGQAINITGGREMH
ncbi:MAG: SDR family oxidoreductase [Planctomycetes bacterium]|nr:SDR family oxidoreductase [Planctomycetota bacterium]